ncbi:uncharacterized protein LOC131624268 [Vicia villosa]|uniref:uncharacterized protein LOC131624268 n=1 Tax=Vicia villosa TaxID=3911 RepID=UPI00273AE8A7|nr:uncharacterized protein LOC131624268 [Vicia villosa]
MWKTLSSALRSQKKIVLTVASSGIASLLLLDGRIAHSKFNIPVPTVDNSTCNIDKDFEHSQIFVATDVIIWDEAPMSHKNFFEALDKTLKDVMGKKGLANTLFGGKVVVFEGDFKQILPVVPRARHSDIVHALICYSYVWDYSQIFEPNDGLVDIEIPQNLLITNYDDHIQAIVESTPNLLENFQDVTYLQGRAILASTIEVVDKINHYVLG